jgi:toxin ParE1/3/4
VSYRVEFAPAAEVQLAALLSYIAEMASPAIAFDFVDAIVEHCESFATFPHRGTMRDDLRPGLRVTSFKKRAVIAFRVKDDVVQVLGIFYGGQDFEAAFERDN